jgi:aryl-alcohol dehydrogenase-like predicted oxidoreductase
MKINKLGSNALPVSEVGLGCWQLGAEWGVDFDKGGAEAILQAAIDGGVRFFDTADVYGNGKSERFIGDFLASAPKASTGLLSPHGDKNPVTVATKYGRNGGIYPDGYSWDGIRWAIDASRERLQTDMLDLLQLHCVPFAILKGGKVWDWLQRLQSDGWIKGFGASVETVEEGLFCLEHEGLQSLQVIMNVMRQKPLEELLPKAADKGVGIIVRLPLNSGLLSGKMQVDTAFAKTDHRNFNRDGAAFNVGETFGGLPFEKGVALAQQLKERYTSSELSLPQLALRWLLDQPAVTTIIPGASRPSQAAANAAVAQLAPLSQETHAELSRFYQSEVAAHIRGPY